MKKLLLTVSWIFVLSGVAHAETKYLVSLPDVPLMPQMSEVTDSSVMFDKAQGRIIEETVKASNLTPEQINAALEMTRKFFNVFLIGGTLIFYLLFGVLASLIGAAVTKKEPRNLTGDINQIGQ